MEKKTWGMLFSALYLSVSPIEAQICTVVEQDYPVNERKFVVPCYNNFRRQAQCS